MFHRSLRHLILSLFLLLLWTGAQGQGGLIVSQSTASNIPFGPLIDSTAHIAGKTGLLTGGTTITATGGTTTSITLASSTGFVIGQQIKGTSGVNNNVFSWITAIPDGTHLTVAPALTGGAPANTDTFSSSQVTILISKDCAAFAPPVGVASELSGGKYYLAATSVDTGTLHSLQFQVAAVGAAAVDPYDGAAMVYAANPYDSVRGGLTALPNAAAEAAGGLYTRGTGAGQIKQTANGQIDTNTVYWNGAAVLVPNVAGSPRVDVGYWLGNGPNVLIGGRLDVSDSAGVTQLKAALTPTTGSVIDAGSTTTIVDSGLTAPFVDSYKGQRVCFTSGANIGLYGTVKSNTTGANSQLTMLVALPAAPGNGDTFTLVVGITRRDVDFLAALGTDNRPKISADVHSGGVSIAGITGTTFQATVPSLAQIVAGLPSDASVATDVWGAAARTLTAQSDSAGVTTLLGRLTSGRAINLDFLDAAISGRMAAGNVTVGGYAANQDPATLVLGATASSWNTALTIGNKINAAGSAGDPWTTALPGAYGAGTAGYILGNRLDAAISSRSTYAGADTAGTTTLLGRLTSGRATGLDFLDAAVSSRSTYAGADTAGVTTLLGRLTSQRAVNLDFLDAAISGRSTYAGGDTPGTTTLLSRIGTPSGASLSADVAGVPAALWGTKFITVPGSGTTSGVSVDLTYKQWAALLDAMMGGDNTYSGPPTASGSFTVTYYYRGASHTSGNIVYIATVPLDGSKNQTGRSGKVAQPFPTIP